MSKQTDGSSDSTATSKGSRPASFPNNNLNAVTCKDLSKSFKNLKVNEKKRLKRNSLTDSDASDSTGTLQQTRIRGAGGGIVTSRYSSVHHHARALQEIRSSLEPYAASDISRESVQNLALELNCDEYTVETAMRNSATIQIAREKLIHILKKKMKDEEISSHESSGPALYSRAGHQSCYPPVTSCIPSIPYRGSPDGASLRADSPVGMSGNNVLWNSKINNTVAMQQTVSAYPPYNTNLTPKKAPYTDKNSHQFPCQYFGKTERWPTSEPPAYPHVYNYNNSGSSISSASDSGNGPNRQIFLSSAHLQQMKIPPLSGDQTDGVFCGQISQQTVSQSDGRNHIDDPALHSAINPGHVQQMIQRMSPSSPAHNTTFFDKPKIRCSATQVSSIPTQKSSVSITSHDCKPRIKGLSPSSNLHQKSPASSRPILASEKVGFKQLSPPSYTVTQKFRLKNEQLNYDTSGSSSVMYESKRGRETNTDAMTMTNREKDWINPINGALSGNINLPMFQSSPSLVHTSSPQSTMSSVFQLPQYVAEPCHASFTTVPSAQILQPVLSQPVSKPQPMTADVPGSYTRYLQQQHSNSYVQPCLPDSIGKPKSFLNEQNYTYQFQSPSYIIERDPPPYSERSSMTKNTVNTNTDVENDESTLQNYQNCDFLSTPEVKQKEKIHPRKPSVADNYLNAVEGNASSNTNTNCNNKHNLQIVPTGKQSPKNSLPKGTEPAIKAARVTGGNNTKRHACSYSAVSAAKQQKPSSISGTNSSERQPAGNVIQMSETEEKTINTSPVPVRKAPKEKTKQGAVGKRICSDLVSSDSEEEARSDQIKIPRTKRIKMFSPEAYKFYMEQHIENVIKGCHSRTSRRMQLEQEMQKMNLPKEDQEQMRTMLYQKESNYIRLKRGKIDKSMFQLLKPLGVGAFGKVYLACKTSSGALYAIKTLKKKDVLKRNQVAHVKAERDILSEADNDWVVRLYYTFQDKNLLYFVMDYIPGGDMMSLLIKKGIFEETLAQFYTAELTLALESVHKMGFIHRDIKPDNILIDRDGHIKLTDFGLCTGFRWTHDSKYYQRGGHVKQDSMDFSNEWNKYGSCALKTLDRRRIRDANRHVARSLVGTPNYIAPEVLLREGYTQLCDWWSVGVILYEMVVGQPPFNANTPEETQYKVINWKQMLRFPDGPRLKNPTKNLIMRLCSDQKQRLGCRGIEEIKQHPYFQSIDWDNMRKTAAPYIPKIRYAEDTSNFDAPDSDFMMNFSQAGTLNSNTLLKDGEHAFFEFTFRRFFDDDGRAYASPHYSEIEAEEEPSEEEMEDSSEYYHQYGSETWADEVRSHVDTHGGDAYV